MRNFHKLAIITIAALLTINMAAASTADLDIFPKQSTTQIDSFTSYEVQITNTGPVDDIYDLSSSNTDEVTIAPRQVPEEGTLEPGESQTVQVWFNPDLGREEGQYKFTVTAESQATGNTYNVDGIVEVIKDHQVNVEIENPGTVCRGEEAVYTVFVTNDGTQEETFTLNADAGVFSQKQVTVDSGETVSVDLTRSSDLDVTDRSFNIRAESTSSYAEDIASTSFNVESCYESSTTINPENQRSAALTDAEFEVTVQNQGTKSDNFVLSTNYGNLEESELTVASGDSRSTTLIYTPQTLENRNIQVTSEGESTSQASSSLEIYNGQEVSVEFSSSSQNVCENERFEKRVTIENTGEAADTYTVSASRGNLSENEIELEPGEMRRMDIEFDSSEYVVGDSYDVEITAQSETFSQPRTSSASSFTVENCWDLEMSVNPKVESAGENRSVLYEISLENTGTMQNEYHVSGEGPEWMSVRPDLVTVDSGNTEKSYIYADNTPPIKEGSYKITATADGENVQKEKTVTLNVGDDVRDSIRSDKGGGITGMFSRYSSSALEAVTGVSSLMKLALSLLVGLVLSAAILYKEW